MMRNNLESDTLDTTAKTGITDRENDLDGRSFMWILIACVLVVLMCALYLKLQSQVTTSNSKIKSLQNEIVLLKENNGTIIDETDSSDKAETDVLKSSTNKTTKNDNDDSSGKIVQYHKIPADGAID